MSDLDDNQLRSALLNNSVSLQGNETLASDAVQSGAIHAPWSRAFEFLRQFQQDQVARRAPRPVVGHDDDGRLAQREQAITQAVARLRLARETVEAWTWITTQMPFADRQRVAHAVDRIGGQEMLDVTREVAAGNPVLARWNEEQKAHADMLDAANQARVAAHQAAWLREAPRRAVDAAESRGAVLKLGRGKSISIEGGQGLPADVVAGLRENRDGVIALLAARAEACAPLVI